MHLKVAARLTKQKWDPGGNAVYFRWLTHFPGIWLLPFLIRADRAGSALPLMDRLHGVINKHL